MIQTVDYKKPFFHFAIMEHLAASYFIGPKAFALKAPGAWNPIPDEAIILSCTAVSNCCPGFALINNLADLCGARRMEDWRACASSV